jgi:hypothetical protein
LQVYIRGEVCPKCRIVHRSFEGIGSKSNKLKSRSSWCPVHQDFAHNL